MGLFALLVDYGRAFLGEPSPGARVVPIGGSAGFYPDSRVGLDIKALLFP